MRGIGWIAGLALLLGLAACGPDAGEPQWAVVQAERPLIDGATVNETIYRTPRLPGGRFDTIRVHRYRAAGKPVASLLFLPGTNMNGASALTDERHNLWLWLAARGIDVFALDYRTNAVPPASDIATLGEMKGWTSEVFMSDVRAARDLMLRETRDVPVFVAGFSRGGVLAFALAAEDRSLAGLIVLDASFKNAGPEAYDAAAAMAAMEAKGIWASDVGGRRGWDSRQALMDAAAENPESPALDSAYPTIGAQLTHVLQTAWGPGALANPEGGISKPQVLARLMRAYDRFYPAIQDIEMKRAAQLADDPATALDDGWGEMAMPVLAFASTGMGADWQANIRHSVEASGSRDVTMTVLDGYGHLDVLVAESAPELVFQPLRDWIAARAAR
ncbi:MAG: alpha/beta hydrolase [Micropepsaceae bacterium]